jgi:tRNA(Ile)-lysidine synthase
MRVPDVEERQTVPDFLTRFREHVVEAELFTPPGTTLLAVSGGPDSVALTHALHATADDLRLALVVAHVDHGIHPRSREWRDVVHALAGHLGLPLLERRLALGAGTSETAARRARYRALRAMQREADARYLVTAHHADDQAETVLFRLLRGSRPAGLAGIPARGPGGLRRPLLPFRRDEVRAWLEVRDPRATVVRDPANEDPAHDRAWMRAVVLPLLRARMPEVDAALARAGEYAALERRAWEALLRTDPSLVLRDCDGAYEVEREPFSRYDKALSVALLRALCWLAGGHLGADRTETFLRFVAAAPSGRTFELGGGWRAETVFDRVRVSPPAHDVEGSEAADVPWGGTPAGEVEWAGWRIAWRHELAGRPDRGGWVAWVAGESGAVRSVRPGDAIRPLGGVGRRPVRRLLMEARVPRPERRTHPIVTLGSEVLWIPGVCRSGVGVPAPDAPAVRLDVRRIGA